MAVQKKVATASTLKKRPPTLDERQKSLVLELPDDKSTPATRIEEFNWLIYGPKGIGKTSLASRFDKSFTMQFEPGGKALSTYQVACPEWIHFKGYVELLKEEPDKFNTLVIDTAQLSYDRCMEYACQKAGIDHPGDEGYGKGWKRVEHEYAATMGYAMSLGMGFIAVSHDKEKEIETKSGRKFTRCCPSLSGQAENFFAGPIDIVGYYHYDGSQRWLQIRGDDYVEAKCRPEDNFIALDGKPVYKIPMGNSPDESYENITRAFNNEQEESYSPEGVGSVRRTTPTKKLANKRVRQ